MKYTIGKSAECEIKIDLPQISSKHCTIQKTLEDYYIIEDLNSTNHTYVNSFKIKIARFTANDNLMLADKKIDNNWLFLQISNLDQQNKTDFRTEFSKLKEIYNSHQEKIKKIDWEFNKKSTYIRVALGLLPLVLSAILPISQSLRIFLMSSSTIFLVPFFVLIQQKNSKATALKEKENIEFQLKYRCPKCGNKFGFSHWQILEAEKSCPRCKAIFA